ncbi:CLUMA_CG008628, isoform A [Clunio marinus]|uniref:CLUMA_CG008628, isoform A n=1 Tax=Clunio marinus TaxID=568069 RepID=A0A1J1I485_9DIPT|nr:CLUMA_CG008628, isoform A [Clunio marinus]
MKSCYTENLTKRLAIYLNKSRALNLFLDENLKGVSKHKNGNAKDGKDQKRLGLLHAEILYKSPYVVVLSTSLAFNIRDNIR